MKKSIQIALFCITLAGITFGLVTPVTVILLEKSNAPGFLIGFITTINYLPFVLFSLLTGKLIKKYGLKKILVFGLFAMTLGVAGHIFWYNYFFLFVIRFITGVGSTLIFVSTEVLINNASNDTNRGKNIGLYVVLLSVGIAVGTLLIWTVEIYDWLPFVIGSAIMIFATITQYSNRIVEILKYEREQSNFSLNEMPAISIVSSFIYGIFESSIFVAIPLFSMRSNFNSSDVSYFLSSVVIGGIILLYFLSMISDRVPKYNLLLVVSFLLGILFLLPGFFMNFIFLLLIYFIIGGLVPAYYTIGLNYTMEKVRRDFIAESNGYYIMFYGVGTLLGPLIAAFLLEIDKNMGFWVFSSSICFLYLAVFTLKGIKDKK